MQRVRLVLAMIVLSSCGTPVDPTWHMSAQNAINACQDSGRTDCPTKGRSLGRAERSHTEVIRA